MTIHFYSKLISTDSIVEALNDLDLSEEERRKLLGIVESSLHHAVLDAILSELSDHDKQLFLQIVTEDDQDSQHKKIWDFLSKKIDKIEEKIVQTGEDLKKELHKDIQETKSKK